MELLDILRTLNDCHGPAGDERGVAAAIRRLAEPYVDTCTVDTMGNLICHKQGSGPKILFAAHMDTVGLVVTHVDEKGFLHFGKLGGVRPHSLLHTPVRFANGVRGLVALDGGTGEKELTLDDLYLDIGAADEKQAGEMVEIGDTAVFDAPVTAQGERIIAPFLDNHISCAVLLLAMEQLASCQSDLYFVFTVQEELGLRGARTAAWAVNPDCGIAVDVTGTDDVPGAKHTASCTLGKGAAVKVMDGSVIAHPQIVEHLTRLARERDIPVQRDVLRAGGTDAGAIHVTRGGVPVGGISIPCRYIHTPVEMVDSRDVQACVSLVAAFAQAPFSGCGAEK
jgi:putative aminopeptidase FrvX